MARSEDKPTVEVVYALPDVQRVVTLPLEPGLTAEQAVERSGLAREFPEIGARALVLGLYGGRIEPGRVLEAGDRVEICRPLERDPRERRRELLRHGLVMGSAWPDED
ncbi:MAG TPA: RnfH family protein [Gammaproteobacteria bacterium]|nr:RnfH family protein [Gammaproteobacteria bacterium]